MSTIRAALFDAAGQPLGLITANRETLDLNAPALGDGPPQWRVIPPEIRALQDVPPMAHLPWFEDPAALYPEGRDIWPGDAP